MTVSDLLEQPCNKSDNAIKLVISCCQLVPNLLKQTRNKQCEHNLLTTCEQTCYNLCVFTRVCRTKVTICRTFCYFSYDKGQSQHRGVPPSYPVADQGYYGHSYPNNEQSYSYENRQSSGPESNVSFS